MRKQGIISDIRAASRAITRKLGMITSRFPAIGSVSQCHAIVELDMHGSMNINQLSELLNLDKSTTSRLVLQLVTDDICCTKADTKDMRNKVVSLTTKGAMLANIIHDEMELQVQQTLDTLSEEEQKVVLQGLSIYARALKNSFSAQRRSAILKL